MSELKAFASDRLRPADFERFKADLELLLTAFTPHKLARWMGKDKGNFSRKINGIEPITPKFLVDFYGKLDTVIIKLREGVAAYEVELEMHGGVGETPADYQRLGEVIRRIKEEIRLIKMMLQEHETAIRELRSGQNGRADAERAQNP